MDFGLLTILLVVGTVVMYVWFFRTSDDNFDEQRRLPFNGDEADEKKSGEEEQS